MALTTKRIIALPSQTDPQEGDYLAIDNATSGTHKIPVGRIGVEVDDTLTEAGKAADAKATGDAIDEIRSQIEVTGTASGAIATFADGSDAPMKSCIASIVPKQSGTGTPSPDNVRAISGWESVNVNVTGKNLLNIHSVGSQRMAANGITFTLNEDGTVTANGTATGTAQIYWNNIPSATYAETWSGKVLNGCPSISGCSLRIEKANSPWTNYATDTGNGATIGAIPSNAGELSIYCRVAQGTTLNNAVFKPMIRVSGASAEYESYNGHTATTSLGRTVYGGTLDVVTGVLTVDRAMVDLGTLTWEMARAGTFYSQTIDNFKTVPNRTTVPNIMCSCYQTSYGDAIVGGSIDKAVANYGTQNRILVRDTTYSNTVDFKTAMSGVQLVYPLATQQTYTLTPTDVSTLLGENNVWADAGDVEVVYVRDLNITINNLLNNSGTRSLGMMAMSVPTEATAEEPTDEQTEEPTEDDMR